MCTYIVPHPFCYQKYPQVFATTETFCLHTHLHSFSSIMGPHSIINSHHPHLLVTQSLCGRWVPHFPSFTCPMQDHTQFSWSLQDYDFDLIPREGRETNNYPLGFISQGLTPAGCMVRLSTTFKGFQPPLKYLSGDPCFLQNYRKFPWVLALRKAFFKKHQTLAAGSCSSSQVCPHGHDLVKGP